MKKIIISLFIISCFIFPLVASAQFGEAFNNLKKVGNTTGLEKDISVSISTIISAALSLVGTIFLILAVYAGIMWMTAGGNEEKVTKAKGIITQAIIGLAITMGAYAITAFVTGSLSGNGGGGSGSGSQTESDTVPGTGGGFDCQKQGGMCIDSKANGGDPCDPPGLGDEDPFDSAIGICAGGAKTCCELKETAGKVTVGQDGVAKNSTTNQGKEKCEALMGGVCTQGTCPPATEDIGSCDPNGLQWDLSCCRVLQ